MIYPNFLKKGNTIGVPAPSAGCADYKHKTKIESAINKMTEAGYKIVTSDYIFNNEKSRSSSAENRGKELNQMFESEDIDFITTASGGEFLVECLPYVDFEKIKNNPKFVQGFSDPTGLLFPITTKYDISTIYGCNFGRYGIEDIAGDIKNNLNIISGNIIEQNSYKKCENWSVETEIDNPLAPYSLIDNVEWKVLNNTKAQIHGRVFAGCFECIVNILGTKYDGSKEFTEKYKEDGIVWIFDVYGISKEDLIRYLWQMNEIGFFNYTSGVLFGRCGFDVSYEGYSMEEALQDSVLAKMNFPVAFDVDITHRSPSMTIVNGSIVDIIVKEGKGKIIQSIK